MTFKGPCAKTLNLLEADSNYWKIYGQNMRSRIATSTILTKMTSQWVSFVLKWLSHAAIDVGEAKFLSLRTGKWATAIICISSEGESITPFFFWLCRALTILQNGTLKAAFYTTG